MKFSKKRLNFDTFMWNLTLTPDLDLLGIKLKVFMRYKCMPNIKCVYGNRTKEDEVFWKKAKFWPIYVTFDLDPWPWPWHVRYQIEGFHEIHLHAKYEVCRCKGDKIISNVKVADKQTNRQTDKQTDRQGKNNMPPSGSGGHKNVNCLFLCNVL